MSIVVNNISKLYGEQKALNDVSFSIASGDIVGFLGPNGAGKSTMMKILTGYIPPTSGGASVCGLDVQEESLLVRAKVGYLPEHNPLYLDMYVKEYLQFVAGIYKLENVKSRVNSMIDMVGLGLEQHKLIGSLSKGYRQRVGLAQALIHDPEVLILDEPTSGLDPNQLDEIRNLIKTIGKEKTVMLSTHIMQEVEAICSRVIIINRGTLVADDTTENMGQYLTKTQVLTVEFSSTIDEKLFSQIPAIISYKSSDNKHWVIETEANVDVREQLFQLAVKHDISVLGMQKEQRNLEEVFKELTK
ncbi:MAG: ABC-2 type transport system ATP-binding protein [Flavobacteriales bacterium]